MNWVFRVHTVVEKSGQSLGLDAPPDDVGTAAKRHLRTGTHLMFVLKVWRFGTLLILYKSV